MTIHPTACIEPGAVLGEQVQVGPFAYIAKDTHIGDHCVIGPHASILPYTTLGAGCHVHGGAVLGDLPQDLAFKPENISYVTIGERTVLREGVTVHRGTRAGTVTEVGDDCLFMANSHVGHNCKVGNRVIMANGALLGGYAQVGDRAFISGNCSVHQFARVGRLAMLSGNTAATKDVPPFCMTRSSSTSTLMGLNVVGLRRAGLTSQERQTLKDAFRILFRSGLMLSTATAQLRQTSDSPLVLELCEFIETSERGICKFFKPGRFNQKTHEADDEENANGHRTASLQRRV